jgi:ribosomal protein L37E
MAIVELTRMEQSALTTILVDHMLRPDSTREWIDIIEQRTVTIEDLLAIVTGVGGRQPPLSIVCPRCGKRSYHPTDREQSYCANCHQFHADILRDWTYGVLHGEPEPSGDFLRHFAEAILRADPDNSVSLHSALAAIAVFE